MTQNFRIIYRCIVGLISLTTFFSSCSSPTYLIRYDLESKQNYDLYTVSDSLFTVRAEPLYNGFKVTFTNKSKHPCFLLWDQSYIIKPDLTTNGALNTDILEISNRVKDPQVAKSLLPADLVTSRFITGVSNIEEFSKYKYTSHSINTLLANYTFSMVEVNTFFNHAYYWPAKQEEILHEEGQPDECDYARRKYLNSIQNNSGYFLGLMISVETPYGIMRYQFDYITTGFRIYKIDSENNQAKLIAVCNKSSNWALIRD